MENKDSPKAEKPEQGLVEANNILPQGPMMSVPAQQISPLVLMAMEKDLDPAKLSALLAVQKDYEANEARKAFYQARAAFKGEDIQIIKDKLVSYTTDKGTTEYTHASLGAALAALNPLLAKHGLEVSHRIHQDMQGGGLITVTAVLAHSMGHSEETPMSASPDASGGKNNIQAIGSTTQYLKRYSAFALIGIEALEGDDDGRTGGGDPAKAIQFITEEQENEINDLVTRSGSDMDNFKRHIKVSRLAEITAEHFEQVKRLLTDKIKRAAEKKDYVPGGEE